MYKIGAFLGGKLMGVFPNSCEYYEEAYNFAKHFSKETKSLIEICLFDADKYTENMEEIIKHSK